MKNKTIEFNTPEGSEKRQATKPLTLEQENKVIRNINALLTGSEGLPLTDNEVEEIQQFVNHYENLNHFRVTTCGLWATDQPDKVQDPEKLLFQIEF